MSKIVDALKGRANPLRKQVNNGSAYIINVIGTVYYIMYVFVVRKDIYMHEERSHGRK